MRHLLVLFFSLPFILAENEFCQQYIECEEKAHAKAVECLTTNALAEAKAPSKWQGCDEAKALHDEIHDLNEKSRGAKDVCIKEKVSSSDALTGKKAERCAAIAQRVSKRSGNEAAKRKARRSKDPKKAAQKLCWREAKRLQTNCQKLVKCCPLVKQCAKQDENKAALVEKKKLLRESTKQCREKNAKSLKHESRPAIANKNTKEKKSKTRLADSVKKAALKKRSAPIGGKKLLLHVGDIVAKI